MQDFTWDYGESHPEEKALYLDGPRDLFGRDSQAIHDAAVREIRKAMDKAKAEGRDEDVVLVGHSRGGHIAAEVARTLAKDGIKVKFLGMYDPVDMTAGFGDCREQVSSNVEHAAQAWVWWWSRWYFNRFNGGVEDPDATDLAEKSFGTTHGGVGGQPGGGPLGIGSEADTEGSHAADAFIREQAAAAGVTLGNWNDR